MVEEEKVVTTLRLPPRMHEALRQMAFDKKISINQEIVDRLGAHEKLTKDLEKLIAKLSKERLCK